MFSKGQRVQSHPATDAFMQRDRYGTVQKVGRLYVHVLMDYSGKVRRFTPNYLLTVD